MKLFYLVSGIIALYLLASIFSIKYREHRSHQEPDFSKVDITTLTYKFDSRFGLFREYIDHYKDSTGIGNTDSFRVGQYIDINSGNTEIYHLLAPTGRGDSAVVRFHSRNEVFYRYLECFEIKMPEDTTFYRLYRHPDNEAAKHAMIWFRDEVMVKSNKEWIYQYPRTIKIKFRIF